MSTSPASRITATPCAPLVDIHRISVTDGTPPTAVYRVWIDGHLVCGRCRDPLLTAASTLLAQGITGPMALRQREAETFAGIVDVQETVTARAGRRFDGLGYPTIGERVKRRPGATSGQERNIQSDGRVSHA